MTSTSFLPSVTYKANTGAQFGLDKRIQSIKRNTSTPHLRQKDQSHGVWEQYQDCIHSLRIQQEFKNTNTSFTGVFSSMYPLLPPSAPSYMKPQSTAPTSHQLPIFASSQPTSFACQKVTKQQAHLCQTSDSLRSKDLSPTSSILSRASPSKAVKEGTHHVTIHSRLPNGFNAGGNHSPNTPQPFNTAIKNGKSTVTSLKQSQNGSLRLRHHQFPRLQLRSQRAAAPQSRYGLDRSCFLLIARPKRKREGAR